MANKPSQATQAQAGIFLPNGRPLRLVASDMDGTLLRSDQTIDPDTKAILLELQERGVQVVLISGRPLQGMLSYAKELEFDRFDGVIIGINGGHAYRVKSKEELWRHTLPAEDAAKFFQAWEPFGLDHIAYGRDVLYMDAPDRLEGLDAQEEGLVYRLKAVTHTAVDLRDLSQLLPEDPTKVCISGPRDRILEGIRTTRPLVEERIYGAFSAETYYEAMLRGVNKGTGLQEYGDQLGILPEEMVAFGDQDNDIPMLAYAGTGVAMEQASEGLIRVASHRTGSHNEGGIYRFLRSLLE